MATVQISLSRAHKVVERLKAKAAACFSEAEGLSSAVSVSGVTGDGQVDRIKSQQAKVLCLLDEGSSYLKALSGVRTAIGQENEARKINARLAELDAINQTLAKYKRVLDLAALSKSAIYPDDLLSYKPLSSSTSSYGLTSLSVHVLSPEGIKQIQEKVQALQKESFQVSDSIAELNAVRFDLEIDDNILAEVMG